MVPYTVVIMGTKAQPLQGFYEADYTDFIVVKNTRSQVCLANRNSGKTGLLENMRPPELPGGGQSY
jgi:hypothetical protein